jgi:hypothetical protein
LTFKPFMGRVFETFSANNFQSKIKLCIINRCKWKYSCSEKQMHHILYTINNWQIFLQNWHCIYVGNKEHLTL